MMTGNLNVGRHYHTASILCDGKVFVTGGYNSGYLESTELYGPVTGSWTMSANMSAKRYRHQASILCDDQVLVTGGCCYIDSAELYDSSTGNWTRIGNINSM
ncbi:unnamed protein product [Adineta ricciae]|uniref:Uncharacterized protein n=1 Tax=Adineta ricciae TaxID=249248 RepID=A0A814TBI7_ADIRI|nr:unnamed protein product [Adineta ricciae]CAF1598594.1 unnamed protein product [Adineta ricciae]